MKVFVLNMRGRPLMPCSPAKARHLLKAGKAVVRRRTPFTIQLRIATGETKQSVTLGVDAGAKHVGLSAATEREEVFASEVELRQDITGLLAARLSLRRERRQRKTRYRAPRFLNRVRSKHKGWLAPSVENRIQAHMSRIDAICGLLPVTKIVIETASFDIQKIKHPDVEGTDYQQGDQLGFWNVREYVLFRDGHVCQHCHGHAKDKILNVHHLESRQTGGDAPNNLITLCETCHKACHAGKIKLKVKRGQSFRAEAFMGIMRWTLLDRVRKTHPKLPVENTYGYLTIAQAHCSWLAQDALRRRLLHCGKSESVAKRRFPLPTTDAKAQPTDTQVFDSQGWSEETQSGAIPRQGVPPIRQGKNRRTDWFCFRATR